MSSTRGDVQTVRHGDSEQSGVDQHRRRIPKNLLYLLLLVLSLLLIWLGYYLEHKSEFFSHLFRDIGISGLVGFILANTFERLWANEFTKLTSKEREAIKRDVFYYVLGHDLPEKIRHEISTQILKKLCMRRNLVMDFELKIVTAPDTGERFMRTICTMSYNIENLTEGRQPFLLRSAVDKSPILSLADETKFIALSVSGSEKDFSYNEQDLKQELKGESEIEIKLEKNIFILPKSKPMTEVKLAYQTVRTLRRGHLDFVFVNHTCDLDLTVRVCDPDVEVFASANSPNKLAKTHRYHPPHYHWRIEEPLLAYQGINVTWILKESTGGGTPSTSTDSQVVTTAVPLITETSVVSGLKVQPIPAAVQTTLPSPEAKPTIAPKTTDQKPATNDG